MQLGLIILFIMGCIALPILDTQHTNKLVEFHQRCSNQGGIVLSAYSANGKEWIGCYKGLAEIINE